MMKQKEAEKKAEDEIKKGDDDEGGAGSRATLDSGLEDSFEPQTLT